MPDRHNTSGGLPLDSAEALRRYTIDDLLPSVAAEAARLSGGLVSSAVRTDGSMQWPPGTAEKLQLLDEKVQLLWLLIRSLRSPEPP